MTQHKPMTLDEEFAVLKKSYELRDAGDMDGAIRIVKTLPMLPYIAKVIKEKVGVDYLLNSGWNLSEVEAEFGSDWLNR